MRCEMCGSDTDLFNAEIEGAMMQVCKSCGSHGEIQSRVEEPEPEPEETTEEPASEDDEQEPITIVVDDYPERVKSAREERGLSQKEMAQRLGEKKSIIHKIETGGVKPSDALAETLENFLDITLLEEFEDETDMETGSVDGEVTIGDAIEI